MPKNYTINVVLQSGSQFAIRVPSENVGEVCAWVAGAESVKEYALVGASIPRHTKAKYENNIAIARLEKGWTQQQLAEAVGVAQQHIQRWEAGVYKPKTATLKSIGEALGVDWTTLIAD